MFLRSIMKKWQVIISAQMIFGKVVLDYEWPTSAKTRTVTVTSVPAGLSVYYDDQVRYVGSRGTSGVHPRVSYVCRC